jgi:hypothetical protein
VHGLIHLQLEEYAESAFGREAWDRVMADAGLEGKVYVPTARYDDAEALELVLAAARARGVGPQALLEDFGTWLVPGLVATYGYLIAPQWHSLDLIENTEEMVHVALRESDELARPPLLRVTRRGQSELLLIYASERQMCGLAKGIARGVGAHYGETLEITEESCMLSGASTCNLAIKRT